MIIGGKVFGTMTASATCTIRNRTIAVIPKKCTTRAKSKPPNRKVRLLELAGLQIREPGQHGDGAGRQHADIERLLHRVVGAEPVRQPERQRGNGVAQDGRGADRQERAPEMSRRNP